MSKVGKFSAFVAAAVLPCAMASAAIVSVGSGIVNQGSANNPIDITLAAGGQLSSYALVLQVGGGGSDLGSSETVANAPFISGGDSAPVGGVFTAGTGNAFTYLGADKFLGLVSAATAAGTVDATGPKTLAKFLIDVAASVPVGIYSLSVFGIDSGDTNFNPPQLITVIPGAITVIPEPAAALLLIGALPLLRRRK
jgi:hypothetical protein